MINVNNAVNYNVLENEQGKTSSASVQPCASERRSQPLDVEGVAILLQAARPPVLCFTLSLWMLT